MKPPRPQMRDGTFHYSSRNPTSGRGLLRQRNLLAEGEEGGREAGGIARGAGLRGLKGGGGVRGVGGGVRHGGDGTDAEPHPV